MRFACALLLLSVSICQQETIRAQETESQECALSNNRNWMPIDGC